MVAMAKKAWFALMNWKTRTGSPRSSVQTRPLPLPRYRAPGAVAGSHAADGSAPHARRRSRRHDGGLHRDRPVALSSRSPGRSVRTRATAPPGCARIGPDQPSVAGIPVHKVGDSSALMAPPSQVERCPPNRVNSNHKADYLENTVQDLKAKTIRGGVARLFSHGTNLLLRVGSLMVLARLVDPQDFGLVGMVTAFTGVLTLFRDFGLSSAAVQRTTVTEEQSSMLFWVNISLGVLLWLVTLAMAPAIAAFYHEPKLFALTAVLAAGFLFNAAGVQHTALLQRQMRFTALSVISVISLAVGSAIAVGGAK